MSALGEWRELRRLTSQRAGAVSQRFASQRLDRYVRSHLGHIGIAAAVILALSVGIWALLGAHPGLQGLAAGVVAGVGLTMLYHWCVLSSGAAASTMGQAAEEWTDAELRRMHRKGWKHVNHLIIKPELGDIDHVAVGPDGVIVVETKWRSHEEDVDQLSGWMDRALRQARDNRYQVVQLLNWQHEDPLLVQSLVVLWGPGIAHESGEAVLASDVNVIAGPHLRDELACLSDQRLAPDAIEVVYAKLKERIADWERWERKTAAPLPVTLQERANQWARRACATWAGLFAAALTLKLGWWGLVAIVVLAGAAFAARRIDEIRPEATSFLVGVLATVPLVLIVAAWTIW